MSGIPLIQRIRCVFSGEGLEDEGMVQLKPVMGSVNLGTTAIYDGPNKRPPACGWNRGRISGCLSSGSVLGPQPQVLQPAPRLPYMSVMLNVADHVSLTPSPRAPLYQVLSVSCALRTGRFPLAR